jgi:D-threo-aldose 1-dehydrogenase
MNLRPLGRTDLSVTPLALGTAPLASVFWGNDEALAVATVRAALDIGIRFFDTAPLYGLGEAETRLGIGLAAAPDVVIATKVGRTLTGDGIEFDFSYDAVRRSLEGSLARLGRDHVDIVHIHDPEDALDTAITEAARAVKTLRDEGVVRALSVGTMVASTAERFLREVDVDCVMVAGRLTLLDQTAAPVLSQCKERGVAFIAAGPFNSGVLARDEPGAWFDYSPASDAIQARVNVLRDVCRAHDVALSDAALHYALSYSSVATLVVGMGSPAEVTANVGALSSPPPAALWEALEKLGVTLPS